MSWEQLPLFSDAEMWKCTRSGAPSRPSALPTLRELAWSWNARFLGWYALFLMGTYDNMILPIGWYLEEVTLKETPYGVCLFMRATNGQESRKASYKDRSRQMCLWGARQVIRSGQLKWRDCENSHNVAKRHKPAKIEHPARGSRRGGGRDR